MNKKLLLAIFAIGLMDFTGILVETAMNIAFPELMHQFHITANVVQWMTTSYLLMVAILVPLSPWFYHRFSRRNLFQVSVFLFACGLLIDIFAQDFFILLFGRFVQGAATGIALPLMFNTIIEDVPRRYLGLMMGIGISMTTLAPAIGPTFGGIVIASLGWRYILVLVFPIICLSFLLGFFFIQNRESKAVDNVPVFNISSYILLACFAIFLVLGCVFIGYENIPILRGTIGIAFIFLMLFIYRSRKVEAPILSLVVFENRSFRLALFSYAIGMFTILGYAFLIPYYAQMVLHSGSRLAGFVMLPGSLITALIGPLSGKVLDTYGAKKPIAFGLSFIILANVFYSLFAQHLHIYQCVLLHLMLMIGTGSSIGNTITYGVSQVLPDLRKDANAFFNMANQLSGAIGTAVITTIMASFQKINPTDIANIVTGAQTCFLVFLLLSVVSATCMFFSLHAKKMAIRVDK